MDIGEIEDADIEAVVALWERCGLTRPWNDPYADIALARRTPTSTVLVGRRDGAIVAAAMTGSDGHRGWAYYVAAEPALQGQGLGRAMMAAVEAWARGQGVPKIQLMVRGGNTPVIGFYQALGYAQEDTVVLGKRFDGKSWSVAGDKADGP
ncbi:MAG: GNAT family acetyltransferase [Proteobacteria bacterium]|nr:GNAT family acetyltransferase [Pseudomonadota bacterium]